MFYRLEFEEDDIVKPEVALVGDPAIELKSLMLSKNKSNKVDLTKLQKFDNDKQIIAGPALVGDKWIFRSDDDEQEYYVMFTPDQVEKFKNAFEKEGAIINFEHSDRKIKAEVLFSEIVNEDQSNIEHFNYNYELKKGDWFLAIHIKNSDDWKEIKGGKHNGFSIEGIFDHNIIAFKNKKEEEEMKKEELEQFKNDILAEFKSMLSKTDDKEEMEDKKDEDNVDAESDENKEVENEDENEEEDLNEDEKEVETEETESETETESDDEDGAEDFEFTQEMYNNILTELGELQNQINEMKENVEEELSYEDKEDMTKLSKHEARVKKLAQNLSKLSK